MKAIVVSEDFRIPGTNIMIEKGDKIRVQPTITEGKFSSLTTTLKSSLKVDGENSSVAKELAKDFFAGSKHLIKKEKEDGEVFYDGNDFGMFFSTFWEEIRGLFGDATDEQADLLDFVD